MKNLQYMQMEEDDNTLRNETKQYWVHDSGLRDLTKIQCDTREISLGYGLWEWTDTREQGFAKFGKPESSIC